MNGIEVIGFAGSLIILISMCFKTTTHKGHLYMRILNFVGSLIYIYYGYRITAYSVIFLNIILAFVNLYYIIYSKKSMETVE